MLRCDFPWLRIVMLVTAVMGPLTVGCGAIRWELDYERGITKASAARCRALVQFYSSLSRDCWDMDRKAFTDKHVQKLMRHFVAVRLDLQLNPKLADQWGVNQVPAFVVVRPDRSVAGTSQEKMTADEFCVFLINHTYN